LSLQELHHQVLCPAIGWTPNYHSFAIRRIHHISNPANGLFTEERKQENFDREKLVLGALAEEIWVGPNFSTALDVFFQPLYIGCALADDRSILLGDLYFDPKRSGPCDLQYVQDFGCWWSHTIEVEASSEKPRTDGSVAVLLGGSGACPPDDSGGVMEYYKMVMKLTGRLSEEQHRESGVDPGDPQWWATMNSEWRSKQNSIGMSNPFVFDLERHQRAMAEALSRPLAKQGTEYLRATNWNFESGFSGMPSGPGGSKPEVHRKATDPTKFCAVCGVTAGLMLCSGCHSIAFCGRAHQLEHWPKHKAACKAQGKSKPSKGTEK